MLKVSMALLEIRTRKRAKEGEVPDSYLSKLVKLIPAEVMALYTAGLAQIPTPLPENQMIVPAVWLIVCFILVIAVRISVTKEKDTAPDWKIVGFSAIAFLIWSYSSSSPWDIYGIYIPYIGSLLVMFWTFFAPYIYDQG
jgi:hypothetical protein